VSDSPLVRISSEIDLSVAGDEDSINELTAEWRELAILAGNAFLTPEWYALSRQRADPETRPVIACAHNDGRLVGVLPMITGPGRAAPLRFAGAALGDRFGPLLAGEDPAGVAKGLYGAALGAAGAKTVELVRVEAESAWWTDPDSRTSVVTDPAGEWPIADLGSEGWDGYLASRSRNHRSQIRRRLRAFHEAHEVSVWSPASAADVDTGIEELFRLHAARWEERSERSRFDRLEAHAFHRDFAHAAATRGWLRLHLLQADGESVAAWYGWRLGDTVSYFQAGYDPHWAPQSVGSVLFSESIRLAAEEGAEVYDMLLGDEAFKLRYATRVVDAVNVMVAPRWSRARFRASATARLKPLWRSIPQGVRSRLRRG